MFVEQDRDLVAVVSLHRALAPALAGNPGTHRERDVGPLGFGVVEVVVTVPARAGVILPEIGEQEGAPAAGVFRVAAHHPQPRALYLLLVLGLCIRGRQRRGDSHRLGPVHVPAGLPLRRAEVDEANERCRLLPPSRRGRLPGGELGRGPRHRRTRDAARGQVTSHLEVLIPVDQPGVRRLAVAAGSSELLVVRVQRGRRVGVQDPAHVGLVDAHAERDGGHDDACRAVQEGGHRGAPFTGGQPGVIKRHPLARCCERVMGGLRTGMRRRVDDSATAEIPDGAGKLSLFVVDGAHPRHREPDVRPVEVADHNRRVAQAEPLHDFLPHGRRGGGCQPKADRCADRARLRSQQHVIRPEVVTPLADQVRFVYHEQAGARTLERLEGLLLGQLLGREEDERIGVAGGQHCRHALAGGLLGVQDDRVQARRPQVQELIVLQRDQWRDDHRRARPQQPGQLVDRRLSAARRQDRENITAGRQRLYCAQLSGTEPLKAQTLLGEFFDHEFVTLSAPVLLTLESS